MTSVTRIPACSTPYCPTRLRSFKGDKAEWHLCFVCQSNTIEHHDAGAGGMGGGRHHKQPENIVALCHADHEAVTTHECSDRIYDLPGKGRTYVYYDVRGKELCERVLDYLPQASKSGGATPRYEPTTEPPKPDTKSIEEGGAEGAVGRPIATSRSEKRRLTAQGADFIDQSPGEAERAGAGVGAVNPDTRRDSMTGSASAPSASPLSSAAEARPARNAVTRAVRAGASERVLVPESGSSAAEPSFYPVPAETSDYCRRGMWFLFLALRLQRMTTELAFEIGDWVNEGEETLGHIASQFHGVFSYWQIAVWASVAGRVPILCRHKALPFGHHQAVAALPESEQTKMLDAAEQGAWKRERLREAVSPSEPKERHECPECHADHVRRVT